MFNAILLNESDGKVSAELAELDEANQNTLWTDGGDGRFTIGGVAPGTHSVRMVSAFSWASPLR